MSGHSKWSKIKHKKGAADKKRSNAFTKLLKAVTVAAAAGGDPDMNFALRLAIQKAKAGNVPKDNIEKAVKRGSGEGKDGVVFEETLYEAFGPGGVALMIECLTDNKNRTISDVKVAVTKNGGSMAGPGSVQWQFEHKGVVRIDAEKKAQIADWDDAQLTLMDAGVTDIQESEEGVTLLAEKDALRAMLDAVTALGIEPDDSGLEWVAKEGVSPEDAILTKVEKVIDALDECDDVKEVYTNIA